MLSRNKFKVILRELKPFIRWGTYREMWFFMAFSEKALVLTFSIMLLLFVTSFSVYIRAKANVTREKFVEIIIQRESLSEETITLKKNQDREDVDAQNESYGEDIESHAAFNEDEEEKEGRLFLDEEKDFRKALEGDSPFQSIDHQIETILDMSKNKISESKKILEGEDEEVSSFQKNKQKNTIKYNLKGRKVLYIQTPAYTCPVGGRIVVKVKVDDMGKVFSSKVDKSKSTSKNECLRQNALRYAKQAKFNISSKLTQKGFITFTYIAK